jgi:hypothetical protein
VTPLERLCASARRPRESARDRPLTGRTHDDADEDTGTFATDSAAGFDPFPLLRALDAAGARAVVIGQCAGIMHGSAEPTVDLDLLWDGDPAGAGALTAAFSAVAARLLDDAGRPVPLAPAAFRLPKVRFAAASAGGDLCTPALRWGLAVGGFLDRAHTTTAADGLTVRYLRRDDLIRMRRASARPKDLRRAGELSRLPD